MEKKETRGRKPSGGRVRTRKLSAKFTEDEKKRILEIVKESGTTQSDFLINASEFYIANHNRKNKVGGEDE